MRKAAWYVGLSYALWGFFPIYWKALAGISSLQLICHRIVWSFVILAVMVGRSREFQELRAAMRSPRVIGIYAIAAVAIATNWLIFVWAVSANQIVQISLGYFINPLVNIVSTVIASAGVASLYYELRTAKEGVGAEDLASVFD